MIAQSSLTDPLRDDCEASDADQGRPSDPDADIIVAKPTARIRLRSQPAHLQMNTIAGLSSLIREACVMHASTEQTGSSVLCAA